MDKKTLDKATLRIQAKGLRQSIAPAQRAAAAQKIQTSFAEEGKSARGQILAAYNPIGTELDPRPLMAWAAAQGLTLALPALEPTALEPTALETAAQLIFRRFSDPADLIEGAFAIHQPKPSCPAVEPDIILLPCLAFDSNGTRLGYGAGHYDRALASSVATKIAVAFAEQEVAHIPREPHDIPLDAVLTQLGLLTF